MNEPQAGLSPAITVTPAGETDRLPGDMKSVEGAGKDMKEQQLLPTRSCISLVFKTRISPFEIATSNSDKNSVSFALDKALDIYCLKLRPILPSSVARFTLPLKWLKHAFAR